MARVVIVLDGVEGMLAGLLVELLLGDISLDEGHDAPVVAFIFADVVVESVLLDIRDLLEGIAGVTVHDYGGIGAVPVNIDVLFPFKTAQWLRPVHVRIRACNTRCFIW